MRIRDLHRRIRFRGARSKLNVQFALMLLLLLVQIAEIVALFKLKAISPGASMALYAFVGVTLGLVGLLLGSRLPILHEATRAEAIAEYINDGLLFIEKGSVIFANSLARKIVFKANVLDVENQRVEMLSPELQSVLEQARTSHAPIPLEVPLGGSKRHFFVSRIHIPGVHTALQRQIFVFQDVTFLRENEEAKVNFIGTLSHEIKTPITSLTMALAMLERIGFDAELVRIANADVARLRILLEDLLNVSKLKIVRNPNVLSKQETNLTALVQQTVKGAAAIAAEKKVRVVTETHPQTTIVANVDPTKISWVLSTLISDAVRQTTTDGTVSVSLRPQDSEATVTISYERKLDSLGPAGYAIVRDIIEAHAGRFFSSHGPNHSSTFKFTIHARVKERTTAEKRGSGTNEAHLIG